MMQAKTKLAIFAKPPVDKEVKTRLIPDIGVDKATEVYRHCLRHTLEVAALSGLQRLLFLTKQSEQPIFQDLALSIQNGRDLGERMLHALNSLNQEGSDGALLIGTDCLDLTPSILQQAAQALDEHELVLLPCFDGGFALIGYKGKGNKTINAKLFEGVIWSSDTVLSQTLSNAKKLNFRVMLLDTVRDIDRLGDMQYYPALLALIDD